MRNTVDDALKLSVFVGSRKRDMEEIRQAIIQAILKAGHIPDGMELWAAGTQPTQKEISDKLALCDVHVIVLGLKYGEMLPQEDISYTHWEFLQSRDTIPPRPVISFLLDEKVFQEEWSKAPTPSSEEEKEKEEKKRNKYMELWELLRTRSVCVMYESTEMKGIAQDVVNSLVQVIDNLDKVRPFAGWVRAESKTARLTAALQDNPFLLRVVNRVVGFQTTGSRFEKEQNAKKAAAEMFWNAMTNQLVEKKYMNIFLESGSSLAYVSDALESRQDRQRGWSIATNNALSLLQLMLFTDGEVCRNPPFAPDPDDPYGAIFTQDCKKAYEEPYSEPRPLKSKEIEAINEIVNRLKANEGNRIILATASGWDTKNKEIGFHGPHVGSHPNMLFKRAIFMTGDPVVLFLTRHKVDHLFDEARFKCRTDEETPPASMRYCYPIFGAELPLKAALERIPLALCIGYEPEKDDPVADFKKLAEKPKGKTIPDIRIIGKRIKEELVYELGAGFNLEYAAKEFVRKDDGSLAGAIMVANRKFVELFQRENQGCLNVS
jgi:hypothetical protein